MQDDDILGKAYDARLMRRLLTYLRPYSGAGGAARSWRSSPARARHWRNPT